MFDHDNHPEAHVDKHCSLLFKNVVYGNHLKGVTVTDRLQDELDYNWQVLNLCTGQHAKSWHSNLRKKIGKVCCLACVASVSIDFSIFSCMRIGASAKNFEEGGGVEGWPEGEEVSFSSSSSLTHFLHLPQFSRGQNSKTQRILACIYQRKTLASLAICCPIGLILDWHWGRLLILLPAWSCLLCIKHFGRSWVLLHNFYSHLLKVQGAGPGWTGHLKWGQSTWYSVREVSCNVKCDHKLVNRR